MDDLWAEASLSDVNSLLLGAERQFLDVGLCFHAFSLQSLPSFTVLLYTVLLELSLLCLHLYILCAMLLLFFWSLRLYVAILRQEPGLPLRPWFKHVLQVCMSYVPRRQSLIFFYILGPLKKVWKFYYYIYFVWVFLYLQAPGFYLGYGSDVFPGLSQALRDNNRFLAAQQTDAIAGSSDISSFVVACYTALPEIQVAHSLLKVIMGTCSSAYNRVSPSHFPYNLESSTSGSCS